MLNQPAEPSGVVKAQRPKKGLSAAAAKNDERAKAQAKEVGTQEEDLRARKVVVISEFAASPEWMASPKSVHNFL